MGSKARPYPMQAQDGLTDGAVNADPIPVCPFIIYQKVTLTRQCPGKIGCSQRNRGIQPVTSSWQNIRIIVHSATYRVRNKVESSRAITKPKLQPWLRKGKKVTRCKISSQGNVKPGIAVQPTLGTQIPIQYGLEIELIAPALRVVTAHRCMNSLLGLLGKCLFPDPAKQPLGTKKILVIEPVKTVAPAQKPHIRNVIFNERRLFNVCRRLHVLTQYPTFAIAQSGLIGNGPSQQRLAESRRTPGFIQRVDRFGRDDDRSAIGELIVGTEDNVVGKFKPDGRFSFGVFRQNYGADHQP